MGFFSKTCAKTNYPVIHHGYGNDWHKKYPEFYEVVVLFPDGRKIQGVYDGYGRIDGVSVFGEDYDDDLWTKIKFVLKKHYAGETYEELKESGDELAQGHFMAEDFIVYCKTLVPDGFKDYAAYKRAFNKHAGW